MSESTLIAIVLDRSGSMERMRDDAIGGFNALLEDQRAVPGEVRLLLAQFDHEYELVHDGVPLDEVPPLTRATFVPRGQTALLDAVGRTMNDVAARIERLAPADRPGKVVFAIITDGEENCSKEFSREAVRQMIEAHQQYHGWQILFLGAVEGAVRESQSWGVDESSTLMFRATPAGMTNVFRSVSASIRRKREGGSAVFSAEDRKKMN